MDITLEDRWDSVEEAKYMTLNINNGDFVDIKVLESGYIYPTDSPNGYEVYRKEGGYEEAYRNLSIEELSYVIEYVKEQLNTEKKLNTKCATSTRQNYNKET